MNKENFIKIIKKKFAFKPKVYKLFYNQIENYYKAFNEYKKMVNNYKTGDEVLLPKGTLIHGVGKSIEIFESIAKDGLICREFMGLKTRGKYPYTVGFWNIQNNIKLSDYINYYSGGTFKFTSLWGKEAVTKVIALDKISDEIKNLEKSGYKRWSAEQTKELRFLPSKLFDFNQIAFILNVDNKYAEELVNIDIFKMKDSRVLKNFIIKKTFKKFISEPRDDFFTNRESAIIFGLPICFVEGVFLGEEYSNNKEIVSMIRNLMPDVYICNIEGKVI